MRAALRITLHTLILALLLSIVSFAVPAPGAEAQPAPLYTLGLEVSPSSPRVGDTITLTLTVLRNGAPSQMGLIQYEASARHPGGDAMNDDEALVRPVEHAGSLSLANPSWSLTFTAVESGRMILSAYANGEVQEADAGGNPFYFFTTATGETRVLTIEGDDDDRPVVIPEPVTVVLFGLGLAGVTLAAMRRR